MDGYCVDQWETPASSYASRRSGNFRLTRHRYSKGHYNMSGLLDSVLWEATKSVSVTALQEKRGGQWRDWMVDDPPHWEAMKFYASQASGEVLCGGLGLGLIQHALADNPAVTRVTTIDHSPDVIALVANQLPKRIDSVILSDFADYTKYLGKTIHRRHAPDWIIVDLWVANGIGEKMRLMFQEILPMRDQLHELFPAAKLIFHGFPTQCDAIWPMSDDIRSALRILAEMRP